MATSVGVGCSVRKNPNEAGREAALKAVAESGVEKPDFVFAFASVGYDQEVLIRSIREVIPETPLSGCSGEGIITREMAVESNFCVCVMVLRSEELRFEHVRVREIGSGTDLGGGRLAEEIMPLLSEDNIACFLFADGLVFDFDPFLAAFEKAMKGKSRLRFFGGLASDNLISRKTYQYHDDEIFSGGISCVLLSGRGTVASGISHGCVPIGTKHTITRSKGNVIYNIDGTPALELLKDYVEEDLSSQWNKLSLNLCLGLKTPEGIRKEYGEYIVRYMVRKNDDEGSVTIQSDVRDGEELWIVRRDKELIGEGLQAISRQIKEGIGDLKPSFVMQFECMGRGKVVFREQEKADLIRSLQAEIGAEIPWIGFYTYGEIGPISNHNCIHNFTAVVVAVC